VYEVLIQGRYVIALREAVCLVRKRDFGRHKPGLGVLIDRGC
jgi:hypothetical protein